eukprot:746673-Hanusia_phi.AAC.3
MSAMSCSIFVLGAPSKLANFCLPRATGERLRPSSGAEMRATSTESGLVMVVDGYLGVYHKEDETGEEKRRNGERVRCGLAEEEFLNYKLSQGESIGDLELIYMSEVRTCSVRALTIATILRISQSDFKTFCTKVTLPVQLTSSLPPDKGS